MHSDVQSGSHNQLFVGRAEELAQLHRAVSNPDWGLLHIYGAGGLGKTALLRQFIADIGADRSFYIDGHDGLRNPNQFMNKILNRLSGESMPARATVEITALLNAYALAQQGIVLLIDTFEQCAMLENWMRSELLPSLSPIVRVCTAGRYPLQGQWMQGSWGRLVSNWELRPLSIPDVRQYAIERGVSSLEAIDSLQYLSRGVPFALTMATDIMINQGESFLERPRQEQVMGFLVQKLVNDINRPWLKRYAEAVSTVWRFDQEMLHALLQEEVTAERFIEFCRLPFVLRHERGWMLHDSVRQWSFTDLRNRMPQLFQDYQARALQVLRKRECTHQDLRAEWAFEKLYLHQHDMIRIFSFQWDDQFTIRECQESDLSRIEELYEAYLQSRKFYIPGDVHLESLIRPLWQAAPSAYIGLWKGELLVAFCFCIMLNEHTIEVLQESQITTPVTTGYQSGDSLGLLGIGGMEPHLEEELTGSLARSLAIILSQNQWIDRKALVVNLLPVSHWLEMLPLFGYERAQWADSSSPMGVRYEAYQLDLHAEDFPTRVDRMFTILEEGMEDHPVVLPIEVAITYVKQVLKHYSRLPFQTDMVRGLLPLLGLQQQAASDLELAAVSLQIRITQALQSLAVGTVVEQRYSQLLDAAYIQQLGSHEFIAQTCQLSLPTYYRHLRMAVHALAERLIKPGL